MGTEGRQLAEGHAMSIRQQIEERCHAIIAPIQRTDGAVIRPDYIARLIGQQLDPNGEAPQEIMWAADLHLRDVVRRVLRRYFDPVERAEAHVNEGQSDLFDGTLQDFYPATRKTKGEIQLVYVERDSLTEDDIDRICRRMERAGGSLLRHSDALRVDFNRRVAAKSAA